MEKIAPEIDLRTLEYKVEPDVWAPVLTVEVLPSEEQDPDRIGLEWSVLSVSPGRLVIQLKFEYPLHISFEKPDLLLVKFADEDLFISSEGIKIPE